MKILVFSDSHTTVDLMCAAVDAELPDRVFHLGDLLPDARALRRFYPKLPVDAVAGNCDGYEPAGETELTLRISGKTFFLTHGHRYGVKNDLCRAVWAAQEAEADILLFGHTHRALLDREGPLWILNPGSISGTGQATYGVITLQDGELSCAISRIL